MPDWASSEYQSDLKHCQLVRDILSELSMSFSADSRCSDCVTQSHLCVICENCIKCVSCTAQSASFCNWVSVKTGILTANQMWVYLVFSLFKTNVQQNCSPLCIIGCSNLSSSDCKSLAFCDSEHCLTSLSLNVLMSWTLAEQV